MRRRLVSIFLCVVMVTTVFAMPVVEKIAPNLKQTFVASGEGENNSAEYVEGEAIIGFYGPMAFTNKQIFNVITTKYGITLKDTNPELCAALYENVDNDTFSQLQDDPEIKYVERNYIINLTETTPNDTDWQFQWGPEAIFAPDAWDSITGDNTDTFKVAVIDSGIDYNHPDISGNYMTGGHDWVNNDDDPMDDHNHGTHCAGIIGAVGNNNRGIAGMTWRIKIIAEKVFDHRLSGTYWNFGRGVVHAVNLGAKIISFSGGGGTDSNTMHRAVQFVYNHGRLLVAATGNNNGAVNYPAKYNEVIAVGAISQNNQRARNPDWGWGLGRGSCFGPELELVAPGTRIHSTLRNQNYGNMSGTSMACPHVSGVAALAWIRNPDLSRDELRGLLNSTADDLGQAGRDDDFGFGRVNASACIENASFRYSINADPATHENVEPLDTITTTVTVSLVQGISQEISLSLDTAYPYTQDLTNIKFTSEFGHPPFTSTLTMEVKETAQFTGKLLRIMGTHWMAGVEIIRFSNFITVSMEEIAGGDIIWIKTSDEDVGNIPAPGYIDKSPDIQSDPDPPQKDQDNTLKITVRNKGDTRSGPVKVNAWFTDWSVMCKIIEWPSVGEKTIDDIPAGGSETITFEWYLPPTYADQCCMYAQAWRPNYEPFTEQFSPTDNNNIAMRNFAEVQTASAYTTTLSIRNPTNHSLSLRLYMTTPGSDWVVDICRPSTLFNSTTVVTPLEIPPGDTIELVLTIFMPDGISSGLVHIWAEIDSYEKLYTNLSGFTFDVRKPPEDEEPNIIEILLPYIIVLLVIIIAVVISAIFFRRRKKKQESSPMMKDQELTKDSG